MPGARTHSSFPLPKGRGGISVKPPISRPTIEVRNTSDRVEGEIERAGFIIPIPFSRVDISCHLMQYWRASCQAYC